MLNSFSVFYDQRKYVFDYVLARRWSAPSTRKISFIVVTTGARNLDLGMSLKDRNRATSSKNKQGIAKVGARKGLWPNRELKNAGTDTLK